MNEKMERRRRKHGGEGWDGRKGVQVGERKGWN